jgi:hypothetical protein
MVVSRVDVEVWTSRDATIGGVTEFVYMHTMITWR